MSHRYLKLSKCKIKWKLTQHCKSTILQFKKKMQCLFPSPHNLLYWPPRTWLMVLISTVIIIMVEWCGKNTGVSCHLLFQGIFPTQELNQHRTTRHLLHWQADALPLALPGKPIDEQRRGQMSASCKGAGTLYRLDNLFLNCLTTVSQLLKLITH